MHLKTWIALSLLAIAVFKRGSSANQPEQTKNAKIEPKILAPVKAESESENPCVDTQPACSFYRRRCDAVKNLTEICPATCDKEKCPEGGCSDKLWDCADKKELCSGNGTVLEVMQAECPVTCSTCDQVPTPASLFTCADTSADCNKLSAKCNQSEVKERCAATCDESCQSPCKDIANDCASRRQHCYKMTVLGALARKECPVACGNCKAVTSSEVSLQVTFRLPSKWTFPPCSLSVDSSNQAVDEETAAKNIEKTLSDLKEEIKSKVSVHLEASTEEFPAYRRLPMKYVEDVRDYEGLVVEISEDGKEIVAICPQSRMYECSGEGVMQDRHEKLIVNVIGPMNEQTVETLKKTIKNALEEMQISVKGVEEVVFPDDSPDNETEKAPCEDTSAACSFYRRRCNDIKDLKALCPATCNPEKCSSVCRERLWDCSSNNETCDMEGVPGEVMKNECPVTCGKCPNDPAEKEPFTCMDTAADCVKIATDCSEAQKERCPATCNVEGCTKGCKDTAEDCLERSAHCYEPTVKGAIAREECPVVCGTCKVPPPEAVICWEEYNRSV